MDRPNQLVFRDCLISCNSKRNKFCLGGGGSLVPDVRALACMGGHKRAPGGGSGYISFSSPEVKQVDFSQHTTVHTIVVAMF